MTNATIDLSRLDAVAPDGSVSRAAIDHLMSQHAGAELTAAQVADLANLPRTAGVGKLMERAVRGGLLRVRKHGHLQLWRLAGSEPSGSTALVDDSYDDERVVRQVSAKAVPSIFAYANQRGAAPFSVSKHTDGRLEVQRNGRVICEFTDAERRIIVTAAREGVA